MNILRCDSYASSLAATREALSAANANIEGAHSREEQLMEILTAERKERELLNESFASLQKVRSE